MPVNKAARVPHGRNVIAYAVSAFALLAGILAWMVVSPGSRPAAAASPPGNVSAPLALIALDRNPAPPNCVTPGDIEMFNWTIEFQSVPDHYIYWITDPNDNTVY